jgi:UDP-N-acetylglucosamine pyrophosphorylase
MDETYFESLEPKRLVEVAKNLYELAVEQLEKLEQSLAHLIRKALAVTQAVDLEAKQIAQWLLDQMRELIHQPD